ncbi:MAG TPA: hypothetical protein PKD85_03120, partial [Saprospiraceae bacterium]|nr:hypothetical protein [Saprospiraceae bacterium]
QLKNYCKAKIKKAVLEHFPYRLKIINPKKPIEMNLLFVNLTFEEHFILTDHLSFGHYFVKVFIKSATQLLV